MANVETIWGPQKVKPDDDKARERMEREQAKHASMKLNVQETKLNERESLVRMQLSRMAELKPSEVIQRLQELEDIFSERKELKSARKEVYKMRNRKSLSTAQKALVKKRERDEQEKKKRLKKMTEK